MMTRLETIFTTIILVIGAILSTIVFFDCHQQQAYKKWIKKHENKDWDQIRDLRCEIGSNLTAHYSRMKDNAEFLALNDELVKELAKAKDAMMRVKMLTNSTSTAFKLRPTRKTIRMSIKNCCNQEFMAKSDPVEMIKFKWFLQAAKNGNWLGLHLHLQPPPGFDGPFRIDTDFALSIMNVFYGKDLVRKGSNGVYGNIDSKSSYTTFKGWSQMAKIEDLLNATNGFLRPDGSIEVEADFTIKSSTLNHLDGPEQSFMGKICGK